MHWSFTAPYKGVRVPMLGIATTLTSQVSIPPCSWHMLQLCSTLHQLVSSLFVLQLAKNIGNSGFNNIVEANLPSSSLKPATHSDM